MAKLIDQFASATSINTSDYQLRVAFFDTQNLSTLFNLHCYQLSYHPLSHYPSPCCTIFARLAWTQARSIAKISSTTSGSDEDQQSRALRRALRKHKRRTGGQQGEPPQSVQEGQQHSVPPEESAPEAEMRRPMQEPPARAEHVHVPPEPMPPIYPQHVQPVSSATVPVQEMQPRLETPSGSMWMDTFLFILDTIKGTICFLWQFIVSIFKIRGFIAPIWFIR